MLPIVEFRISSGGGEAECLQHIRSALHQPLLPIIIIEPGRAAPQAGYICIISLESSTSAGVYGKVLIRYARTLRGLDWGF